jgi:hypothetical protein
MLYTGEIKVDSDDLACRIDAECVRPQGDPDSQSF